MFPGSWTGSSRTRRSTVSLPVGRKDLCLPRQGPTVYGTRHQPSTDSRYTPWPPFILDVGSTQSSRFGSRRTLERGGKGHLEVSGTFVRRKIRTDSRVGKTAVQTDSEIDQDNQIF